MRAVVLGPAGGRSVACVTVWFNAAPSADLFVGLLAATALVRDWTLVTRNTEDFARSGVRLLNPWEDGVAR